MEKQQKRAEKLANRLARSADKKANPDGTIDDSPAMSAADLEREFWAEDEPEEKPED